MTGCAAESDLETAAGYCRAARRLRGRFRGRPGRLHAELAALGAGAGKSPEVRGETVSAEQARAAGFAREVEAGVEGPVLRFSQRKRLLKAAARAGIGRFEANLIIAAVQHRRRAGETAPEKNVRPGSAGLARFSGQASARNNPDPL